MLQIEQEKPLAALTTFKIGGPAREFAHIEAPEDIPKALDYAETKGLRVLVLGGGSNMLVSDNGFDGLVIEIANRGIEMEPGHAGSISMRVASGEIWDDVVAYSVEHHLWGIENLSRIPGKAGSVAVQNVGAYGQEAKDVIVQVDVFDRKTKMFRTLLNADCNFTYRKSIFNTIEKDRYVILSTTFRLSTKPHRNLSYPDVRKYFEGNPEPTQLEIRHAIKEIRDRKFPFPAESVEGNAGSFFKNSLVTVEEIGNITKSFEQNLPEYLHRLTQYLPSPPFLQTSTLKIPSAFILEACGLRGYRSGDVMLNPTQPVVVLNVTGKASARAVLKLVKEVRTVVEENTGLHLLTEPELIGFSEEELREFGFVEDEIDRYVAR